MEFPVRCLALLRALALRALALRAPGLFVDSEGCMMCGITLWGIPRRQFDGVARVGCSVAIVFETVARIHEVKYFKSVIYSGNTRMGEARRGKA